MLVTDFRALNIKKRPGCLRVTESNFAQAAFHDKLSSLWSSFSSLNSALDLLLHALHVIVTSTAVSSGSKSVVCLEEVCLSELTGGLLGVLTRSTTDLAENLVVEVLGDGSLGTSLIEITGRSHKLLELDTRDEVFVLRCHETVVLG
jgi:hypothetical protein